MWSEKDVHELSRRVGRGATCDRIAADNGWAGSSVRTLARILRPGAPNQHEGRSELIGVDTACQKAFQLDESPRVSMELSLSVVRRDAVVNISTCSTNAHSRRNGGCIRRLVRRLSF